MSISSDDLKEQIVSFLQVRQEYTPTDIIVEEMETSKSLVNRALYSLLSTKIVEKNSDNHWRYSSLRDEVLKSLHESENQETRLLASKLNITKTEVNSILYSLERANLAIKTADELGRNPRWKLKPTIVSN